MFLLLPKYFSLYLSRKNLCSTLKYKEKHES